MSRIELQGKDPNVQVIVGLDRPLQQWFYQIWDYNQEDEAPTRCSMDECLPFRGASQGEVLEVIAEYAAPSERRTLVERYIGFDLDPGDAELPD